MGGFRKFDDAASNDFRSTRQALTGSLAAAALADLCAAFPLMPTTTRSSLVLVPVRREAGRCFSTAALLRFQQFK
jgi:hypothetical protein